MYTIKRIEIQYFRSIYNIVIKDISDICILTGKNDVGKSNVLKALNLFFNNHVDDEHEFSFEDNFNLKRLGEVRRDSIKGKQFIRIKVTFNRGNMFEKTLPSIFSVTKKWYRNDIYPSDMKNDIEMRMRTEKMQYNERRCKTSLTRFLNKIKFFYVPAIKDRSLYKNMLKQLRETIYNDKWFEDVELKKSLDKAAEKVSEVTRELNAEFYKATRIYTEIVSPRDIKSLYRSLEITTGTSEGNVGLSERGDGIQVRYIPSILNFISESATKICIWGYEEPENSLEYNLALQMADDFKDYASNNQIFLTTHSPAFIQLQNNVDVKVYRCYKINEQTNVVDIIEAEKLDALSEELGYMKLLNEQYEKYNIRLREMNKIKKESESIKQELKLYKKPILMTEGKTDAIILSEAWKRLYKYECPFIIKSCNIYSENVDLSAAGSDMLQETLETWKYDSPNVLIGMFDNDQKGIKCYNNLNRNFITNTADLWKKHKNGKSYAFLLPQIKGRERFVEYKNLCIEFYFDDESLKKTINGEKLEFETEPVYEIWGNQKINKRYPDIDTQLYLYKPKRNKKTFFAERIVPMLSDEKFEPFKVIFEKVLHIIEDYEKGKIVSESAISIE